MTNIFLSNGEHFFLELTIPVKVEIVVRFSWLNTLSGCSSWSTSGSGFSSSPIQRAMSSSVTWKLPKWKDSLA